MFTRTQTSVTRLQAKDIILMFKIMNGLVRMDTSVLFSPTRLGFPRGHTRKVYKNHAVKAARVYSFSQRVLNDWNALPNYVVMVPSLNSFKKVLDDHWQDIQDIIVHYIPSPRQQAKPFLMEINYYYYYN